ncbi:ribonuclease P protein component [Mycoplasma sp. 'Moose RK']|uniref:ribonuclease P protein component n=1 Tax=Mycoplasma sp. 'Moose RK' TaxID=2780095 RepID=UPI0018C205DA|nr:ribonuclease P protein component [Mycoplasma sp. 'Moose RK']MBG0730521.1 ribonuclease P protein component [Mycoplasma sp. 'Moose RK']
MQKIQTIKKNWQFQAIISPKSDQIVTNELVIYYEKFDFFEIGISIPKKFVNAVKRNYFKRQIRNILSDFSKKSKFPKIRIVLISRRPFLNLSFAKKKEKLEKIFEQLKKNEK